MIDITQVRIFALQMAREMNQNSWAETVIKDAKLLEDYILGRPAEPIEQDPFAACKAAPIAPYGSEHNITADDLPADLFFQDGHD